MVAQAISHTRATLPSATATTKAKVVFVMGATGTGKSRLAIDLAARFNGEVINSDKMQVYKGLDTVTNKVTPEECRGIPHHLLGTVEPYEDFKASDFRRLVMDTVGTILARGRLPIIAGGSNSFIEELVDGDNRKFQTKYDCLFLWVDVSLPVLDSFVSERVDRMVELGMIGEVKEMFDPKDLDCSRGIKRSIGFPEISRFLRKENPESEAIKEIKDNTCKLARNQLRKINRLNTKPNWNMKKLDATEVFLRLGDKEDADETWERLVANTSVGIVENFLCNRVKEQDFTKDAKIKKTTTTTTSPTCGEAKAISTVAVTLLSATRVENPNHFSVGPTFFAANLLSYKSRSFNGN